MNSANRAGSGRIAALDGWRGISILSVVAAHLLNYRYGSYVHAVTFDIPYVVARWGVALFFVISGYIITTLAIREASESRFSVGAFYVGASSGSRRRFMCIWGASR